MTQIALSFKLGGWHGCHIRPPSNLRYIKRWWLWLLSYAITYTNVEHVNRAAVRKQNSIHGQQLFHGGWCLVLIKMWLYYCWRYWKQQCGLPVTHLSNFSRGLSWGGITESWCILPWVGIKDKYNYSSSFRFKTGPRAEKSRPTDPLVKRTLQSGFLLKYNKAFYLFFFLLKSNNHVLHYRL